MNAAKATEAVVVITNPAAGRGRGAVRGEAVVRALRNAGTSTVCIESTRPGDERRLARDAAHSGARAVAIVGGDGTIHHAARGLLDAADEATERPTPPLAIFSAGTGNDLVKSLGVPSHDIDAMVRRVLTGQVQAIDVGYVDEVPFVNAAGFGFDVEVLERMQRGREHGSRLEGTAAYVLTALGALGSYRGFDMAIGDGSTRRHLMAVFANGRCFGGTFHIAPEASLHDGALDCVVIRDVPRWARIPLFMQATRGRHIANRRVHWSTTSGVTLRFPAPPAFECDGERHQAGACEVQVSVRPGALRVVV